jgi:hypothetical protein
LDARRLSASLAEPAGINVAGLESAVCICDDQIAACMAVHDALKARTFYGDFDKLLQWWQQN